MTADGTWTCQIKEPAEAASVSLGSTTSGTQTLEVAATLALSSTITAQGNGVVNLKAGGEGIEVGSDASIVTLDWTSGTMTGADFEIGTLNLMGTGSHPVGVKTTVTTGGSWESAGPLALANVLTIAESATFTASQPGPVQYQVFFFVFYFYYCCHAGVCARVVL